MTTTTYAEAIKSGQTRVFSIEFGSIITMRMAFGKVQIEIEASETSTSRRPGDELTYLPANAIID